MNQHAAFTEQIGQNFQDILVGQPAFDAHGQALSSELGSRYGRAGRRGCDPA